MAQDKEVYPNGLITGYYGVLTKKAVERFQKKYGIANQGEAGYSEVGPKTRAKLNQLLAGTQATIPQLPAVSSEQAQLVQQIKAQIQILQEQLSKLLAELAQKLQEEVEQKQSQ